MILVKLHESKVSELLTLCDENLIGKKMNNLTISEEFYKGTQHSEKDLLKLVKENYNINAIGKESIEFLLQHNIMEKENIVIIDGIPHTQVFSL
jgi:uncharacterized protein